MTTPSRVHDAPSSSVDACPAPPPVDPTLVAARAVGRTPEERRQLEEMLARRRAQRAAAGRGHTAIVAGRMPEVRAACDGDRSGQQRNSGVEGIQVTADVRPAAVPVERTAAGWGAAGSMSFAEVYAMVMRERQASMRRNPPNDRDLVLGRRGRYYRF